jgi:AraC family transcriptional activator FtrA
MNERLHPEQKQHGAARVAILGFDGVDELDLFGVYAILSKARNAGIAQVEIWSRKGLLRATGGVEVRTRTLEPELDGCDILVVPGGSGALATAKTGQLNKAVRQARKRNARLYCCCSGALIVAAALRPTEGQMAIHKRKQDDLRTFFGGEIVSGIADSEGIYSIGGKSFEGVKSVILAFRVLSDLDAALSLRIAERTEISWR